MLQSKREKEKQDWKFFHFPEMYQGLNFAMNERATCFIFLFNPRFKFKSNNHNKMKTKFYAKEKNVRCLNNQAIPTNTKWKINVIKKMKNTLATY